jgi:hypothetical protein
MFGGQTVGTKTSSSRGSRKDGFSAARHDAYEVKNKGRNQMRHYHGLAASAFALVTAVISAPTALAAESVASTPAVNIEVFVNSGLINPRGLHFGPDHKLYVAEGGTGGTTATTEQQCRQVPEIGPYKGSPTGGRISRIDAAG